MKLSAKRRTDVYAAIYEPVMQARIALQPRLQEGDDSRLAAVVEQIWRGVKESLGVSDA